jgi:hypothetical protein
LALQGAKNDHSFEVHFRSLLQVDPKPSEAVKALDKICSQIKTEQSILVSADAAGVLGFYYCGIFPLAKIDMNKLVAIKDSTIICDKIDVNEDCTETVILGRNSRSQFILRLDTSALSSLVFKSSFAQHSMRTLPMLEHYVAFVDKQVTNCKREWTKFYSKYIINMKVLIEKVQERQQRHRSSATTPY